jgi:hypothetical protein
MVMKETKNQRLAKEMTEFCIQRVKTPAAKPKKVKTLLQPTLAAFLAVALMSGASETDHMSWWIT